MIDDRQDRPANITLPDSSPRDLEHALQRNPCPVHDFGESSIRGSRSRSATYSFSSVLSAMYGHMSQLQFPSPPGTPMKVLFGAAFSI